MAHNLFGERFYSHREPAWHRLGLVLEEELSAQEALRRVGTIEVVTEQLVTASGIPTEYRGIIRRPTKDDPMNRIFGVVGREYTLITPNDAAQIWDEKVNRPVETLGLLGQGESLFISTILPTINVKGEEVKNYLLLDSPMTGKNVAEVRVTPVRVVCQNTLRLSASLASETYQVIHDETALIRLGSWLRGIYERAVAKTEALKEVFEILANTRTTPETLESILATTYPYPKIPRENAPAEVLKTRFESYEYQKELVGARREHVKTLFDGKGLGMDSPAAKGTMWGLYNSVVEFEDYRRGWDKDNVAMQVMFGPRAVTKERAFKAVMETCAN